MKTVTGCSAGIHGTGDCDEAEMRRMCEAGVLVYAVQMLETGCQQGRMAALQCLDDALCCESSEIHLHVLGLGLVPLLWKLSDAGDSTDPECHLFAAGVREVRDCACL